MHKHAHCSALKSEIRKQKDTNYCSLYIKFILVKVSFLGIKENRSLAVLPLCV